jgi:hypothetical protein
MDYILGQYKTNKPLYGYLINEAQEVIKLAIGTMDYIPGQYKTNKPL